MQASGMLLASFTIAATFANVGSAIAQQTITIVVGFSSGGNYDIHIRTFARHLGRHLPGNPTVVVQNMAGAGSLRATNFLYNMAPKDGTTMGTFARGMAMQPLPRRQGHPVRRAQVQLDRQLRLGSQHRARLAFEAVQDD